MGKVFNEPCFCFGMNVVIVHGSNSKDRENMRKYNLPPQNERGWIVWVKKKLEEGGIECTAPLMPRNWAPVYEEWKAEFEKIEIDKNSVLVGWSSGAAFLVRWLGDNDIEINKLILVAPAIHHQNASSATIKDFHNFQINHNIKNRIQEIVLIESSNDSEEILESCKIYSKELGVSPVVLKDRGHFTDRGGGENYTFPELLGEIL